MKYVSIVGKMPNAKAVLGFIQMKLSVSVNALS
jgi:hypothetical protein